MESALCASCAFAWRELALLRGWVRRAAKDDKEYQTHPRTADGAFVFGFVPSETVFAVNGKGKGKQVEVIDVDVEKEGVSTLLGPAARALGRYHGRGEEEACRRKVWGLRCGHLIDGKWFEELRKPVEVEDPDSGALDATERPPSPEPEDNGKGKAKAPELAEEEQEQQDDLFDNDTTNNIRSRLRSRASGSGAPSMAGAFEIAVPLPSPPRRRAPPKRKVKPKPKPRKPIVEARYEWTCPVASCGRVHVSEKIDGVWVNAAEKGAIGSLTTAKSRHHTKTLCDAGFLQFLEGQEGKEGMY
jgi:hypothetical protein